MWFVPQDGAHSLRKGRRDADNDSEHEGPGTNRFSPSAVSVRVSCAPGALE